MEKKTMNPHISIEIRRELGTGSMTMLYVTANKMFGKCKTGVGRRGER